ncbi:hypothetical protein BGZ91_004583 [Linnemannia elongata]|nr:hypothetical protein BGZ91_004583 [Linnemannia elongata]
MGLDIITLRKGLAGIIETAKWNSSKRKLEILPSLDTVEDGLGSIGMWAVLRQEEKGVATVSDGVPDPLGLVKFGVVHEKNAVSGFETGEHLVL